MSRLFLLRHAKAAWAAPGMRDFDRPLEASGEIDARSLGETMRAAGHSPFVTLCSGAKRTRETLEHLCGETGETHFLDALYSEDAAGYLTIIREYGGESSALVIGHNPMTEDLAIALAGDGDPVAMSRLGGGFPTSGLAIIDFEGPLSQAAPAKGFLRQFLTPKDR